MYVKATREGRTGHVTASGWIVNDQVPFVALPSRAALYQWVKVTNPLSAISGVPRAVRAIVLDVGPHHVNDDSYVFGKSRPYAETDGSNKSGIDLGDLVWKLLDMKDNTSVYWEFVSLNCDVI